MKLYFGNHIYTTGNRLSIEELAEKGMVKSKVEELRNYGFAYNRVSSINSYEMAKNISKLIVNNQTINELYYDSCFGDNLNVSTSTQISIDSRNEMENFMNYPAMHLCNELNLKNLKYYGLSQLGCSGLFSCIELACNSVRCADTSKSCLCITSEKVPNNCYYDRPEQKLLHSEATSGCLVSNKKLNYEIIGYASTTNSNLKNKMLEIIVTFASMTKIMFDKYSINIADVENILTPNFWPDFWLQLVLLLKGNKKTLHFDNIAEIAHAFSSDFIINLMKLESEGLIHTDNIQIAYGYGYGSHMHCLIFKKVGTV